MSSVRIAGICGILCVAAGSRVLGADEVRQIFAREYYGTFSHANAVLERIKPGEVIFTRTIDADGYDQKGDVRSGLVNALTGPFYVEDANSGDALVVRFRKVR